MLIFPNKRILSDKLNSEALNTLLGIQRGWVNWPKCFYVLFSQAKKTHCWHLLTSSQTKFTHSQLGLQYRISESYSHISPVEALNWWFTMSEPILKLMMANKKNVIHGNIIAIFALRTNKLLASLWEYVRFLVVFNGKYKIDIQTNFMLCSFTVLRLSSIERFTHNQKQQQFARFIIYKIAKEAFYFDGEYENCAMPKSQHLIKV